MRPTPIATLALAAACNPACHARSPWCLIVGLNAYETGAKKQQESCIDAEPFGATRGDERLDRVERHAVDGDILAIHAAARVHLFQSGRAEQGASPTGPLHAGSLVAALASWLDARAHNGRWLVRMEDVDQPRCVPGADTFILQQLAACGLHPDAPPQWQSARSGLYQHAQDQLVAQGDAYPCACSRKDIEDAHAAHGQARERHAALPYPGTCRRGLHGRTGRSWRFNVTDFKPKQPIALVDHAWGATYSVADGLLQWHDRRLGRQQQQVANAVGDFVLRRAD
eukprot:gene10742-13768_t